MDSFKLCDLKQATVLCWDLLSWTGIFFIVGTIYFLAEELPQQDTQNTQTNGRYTEKCRSSSVNNDDGSRSKNSSSQLKSPNSTKQDGTIKTAVSIANSTVSKGRHSSKDRRRSSRRFLLDLKVTNRSKTKSGEDAAGQTRDDTSIGETNDKAEVVLPFHERFVPFDEVKRDTIEPAENKPLDKVSTLNVKEKTKVEESPVLKHSEAKMAENNISKLIQEGQTACEEGRKSEAKRKALQAKVATDKEKNKLIGGQKTAINEQQLGDWYGGCSFILNKIDANIDATRCFYTATVFDPSWNVNTHKDVSNVLWKSVVFLQDPKELSANWQVLTSLLYELDELAQLAEFRRKLPVCVAIDGDINKVYAYLMKERVLKDELIKQPGRRASLWRSARCFLRMGMHDDARKLCSTILQYACDYDDPEAFEMWAVSLYTTGDFDIALQKCELALKHCKNAEYRCRLEALCSEIKKKLESTGVDSVSQTGNQQKTEISAGLQGRRFSKDQKQSRKNRSCKDTDNTKRYLHSSKSAPDLNKRKGSVDSVRIGTQKQIPNETILYKRTRTVSACSNSTLDSETTEFSFEGSGQESLSDSENSFDSTSFSREATPDTHAECDIDSDDDALDDEMTFFEQSMRYYLNNEDNDEYSGKSDSYDKLLKYGIKLNDSYLHQFQDRHPAIIKRDNFYTEFLSKDKLQQKLLQNPKKYIRCIILIEGSHEAYCTPIDTSESMHVIEISGRSKVGQVFNEDEVVVEILDEEHAKGKRFGKVIGVWNRQRHKDTKHPVFMCTLDDLETTLVRPMCKTIPKIHVIDREISQKYKTVNRKRYKIETYDYDEVAGGLCNPKIVHLNPAEQRSYIFLVAFISWSPRHIYPRGAIIKMLQPGLTEASGLRILSLQHEVPTLYRKATVDQVSSLSRRLGDEPAENLLQGRKNFTGLHTLTIDPLGSKDLDDALSIQTIDGGFKVGVHISDVASYVKLNSPLDEESKQRATTFYPGIRRPRNMLPEPFSTNICSLLPSKRRLTISVFFYLTEMGRPMQMEGNNFEIHKSYIRSSRRLTYEEAQNIILLPKSEVMDQVTKDVKALFKVAKEIRKNRLGNAMFALDLDWDESSQGEPENQNAEAHYLVEEFMVMANRRVANWLFRHRYKGFPQSVPLRCQPPPSKENIEEFLQKNGDYLDVVLRLQDKQIGSKRPNFREKMSSNTPSTTSKSVMVTSEVWRSMVNTPKNASEYVRKDGLHPLQLAIYQHWLTIQERAGYRCSGSIKGEEDGKHCSLDMYPYTHFTSPIRRYIDLIVQRLVHAALVNAPCPYKKDEVEDICIYINSVTKRAKEYEKGCKALQKAIEFKTNPKMLNCFVDDVSDRGLSLCSPWLQFVPKQQRELTFNLLDMGHKPEVNEDPDTKWNKVVAMWRKRLYDFNVKPKYKPAHDNMYRINPHKGMVFLPCYEWARMLRATVEEHKEDLTRAITNATIIKQPFIGYEDVTTECQNPLKIQPNTKFTMVFSRGQQLKIQMSAAPNKGIVAPKPVLYCMTNNVKFCLQHIENPVLHLYRYVTSPTCDKYPSVKLYLERWIPLILMEAATGIVRNEESCCINNIQIKFLQDMKGQFSLGLAECEVRNIELSGSAAEDKDDLSSDETTGSFDWLCIKAEVPNATTFNVACKSELQPCKPFWVGHAAVTNVVKKKTDHRDPDDGRINVTFRLHERSPVPPLNIPSTTKFSIEILKKSEVDRRTESFIKELPSQNDSLAAKIALNKPIPDFDRGRAHIASLRNNQDLVFVVNKDDPVQRRTVLPMNNPKQQEAVNKSLKSRFSLIQGPPGTGKTYTGIKLMYLFDRINEQLSKEGQPRKQVLFCGPSNKSVDLVAKWMLQRMEGYKPNFIRVYGRSIEAIEFPIPGRTFLSKRSTRGQHTDPDLKSVSLHHLIREKGKKYAEEINAKDRLFKQNNYEPMPDIVKEYVHTVREASIEEIRKHDVILCTTAVGANPKVLEATNVYQVIVDEAGMCPEPQCLVPIIATKAEQVVLIGDHKQLRPIIMCKEAAKLGLETSLFERYATTHSKNVQFTRLEQQYRMNPEICKFPSKMFYDSSLKTMPGKWSRESLGIWPRDAKGVYPHVLVHIEGEEKVLTVSTEDGNEQSRSNEAEINHVITTYMYLKREVPNGKVQILSQYNAQCSEIKRRLKQEGVREYNEVVSTVVSSQGGEWSYVIFSTVRSLPDYKIEKNPTLGWCKHNLGFITDRNQVNVAITRAQKGLIIIGNKELLGCDFVWKRLIKHYADRGCLKTPEEFPPLNIRKSRQQIMEEAQARTYRVYGDSIFEKGEATSYEGTFDEDYNEDDLWKPRVQARYT